MSKNVMPTMVAPTTVMNGSANHLDLKIGQDDGLLKPPLLPFAMPSESVSLAKVAQRLGDLGSCLKTMFIERDEVIDGLILAAVSGESLAMLGDPGTTKTLLIRAFMHGISGANLFVRQLHGESTMRDLFGPVSLRGLRADNYVRVVAGMLPEAHVAYIDEFTRGVGLHDALLQTMNERQFDNGLFGPTKMPLMGLFGSANDYPEDAAFWDRWVIRHKVGYVTTKQHFLEMLAADPKVEDVSAVMTINDLACVQLMVGDVALTNEADEAIADVWSDLKAHPEPVIASDRRWKKLRWLAKAQALIRGKQTADPSDVGLVARHVLWTWDHQIPVVRSVVEKHCATEQFKLEQTRGTLTRAFEAARSATAAQAQKKGEEAIRLFEHFERTLPTLETQAHSDLAFARQLNRLKTDVRGMKDRLIELLSEGGERG
ncbi:MAG: AAA domain-containing protein [Anaerolineae bacterium]|nr:AAA domain-containing protein [Anaerolineae bacterium]